MIIELNFEKKKAKQWKIRQQKLETSACKSIKNV